MNTMKWIDATSAYLKLKLKLKLTASQGRKLMADPIRAAERKTLADEGAKKQQQLEAEIKQATEELEEFLAREGDVVLHLLEASGRYISFGERTEGPNKIDVHYLCGRGLEHSNEWFGEVRFQDPLFAYQAISVAVYEGKMKPSEILPWLKQEIDKIAADAPVGHDD